MPSVLELFSLSGQTALVTGGTRGLGQAMAIAVAEAGAEVVLLQRDIENKKTQEMIQASTGQLPKIYAFDLASKSTLASDFTEIVSENPGASILLNCGAIQKRHPTTEYPLDEWEEVMDVNLTAPFLLCKEFGKHLLSKPPADSSGRRGSIINVASLLSFQGGFTVPAYAASKGGVAQLTKALSNEWAGKGINVNAIAPGYIATDMNTALMADETRARQIIERIPAGRWGNPDDFKGVVVWLASRASAYVSGELVTVDGGWMGR